MEEWVDVKGYEGIYQVSNLGRVKGMERVSSGAWGNANYKEAIRSSYVKRSSGYEYISLFKNKKRRIHAVHRLVCNAFIPNPQNKEHVNHIDKNRGNNLLVNLEWATPKENVRHSITKPVVALNKDNIPVKIFKGAAIAADIMGISRNGIYKSLRGKMSVYAGFKWKYFEETC